MTDLLLSTTPETSTNAEILKGASLFLSIGTILFTIWFVKPSKQFNLILDIDPIIAQKAQDTVVYAALSITGIATLICSPIAVISALQTLRLIRQSQSGDQYRRKTYMALVVAVLAGLVWMGVCCWVYVLLMPYM
ncbi:hypothetical protein QUF63_10125 [Anaerolineales bacterium HSG25]|nr:hypothetical protein [Anaerolineales bacterium HSG25]